MCCQAVVLVTCWSPVMQDSTGNASNVYCSCSCRGSGCLSSDSRGQLPTVVTYVIGATEALEWPSTHLMVTFGEELSYASLHRESKQAAVRTATMKVQHKVWKREDAAAAQSGLEDAANAGSAAASTSGPAAGGHGHSCQQEQFNQNQKRLREHEAVGAEAAGTAYKHSEEPPAKRLQQQNGTSQAEGMFA